MNFRSRKNSTVCVKYIWRMNSRWRMNFIGRKNSTGGYDFSHFNTGYNVLKYVINKNDIFTRIPLPSCVVFVMISSELAFKTTILTVISHTNLCRVGFKTWSLLILAPIVDPAVGLRAVRRDFSTAPAHISLAAAAAARIRM